METTTNNTSVSSDKNSNNTSIVVVLVVSDDSSRKVFSSTTCIVFVCVFKGKIVKNFVSQRFFLIDCFLVFLNAVKRTPKTPPTIADPNAFILLFVLVLCFSFAFCSRRLLSSSTIVLFVNFLSGGFAGLSLSFPW